MIKRPGLSKAWKSYVPGSANACYPVCAALDWCVCVAAHMMLAVSVLLELQLWLC